MNYFSNWSYLFLYLVTLTAINRITIYSVSYLLYVVRPGLKFYSVSRNIDINSLSLDFVKEQRLMADILRDNMHATYFRKEPCLPLSVCPFRPRVPFDNFALYFAYRRAASIFIDNLWNITIIVQIQKEKHSVKVAMLVTSTLPPVLIKGWSNLYYSENFNFFHISRHWFIIDIIY